MKIESLMYPWRTLDRQVLPLYFESVIFEVIYRDTRKGVGVRVHNEGVILVQ
jgi:hypothetical protein